MYFNGVDSKWGRHGIEVQFLQHVPYAKMRIVSREAGLSVQAVRIMLKIWSAFGVVGFSRLQKELEKAGTVKQNGRRD